MADPRFRKEGAKKRDRPALAEYAKEWRRKAQPKAMYHEDDAIAQHYNITHSVSRTADELGMSFYTARAALQRQGIDTRRK